MQSAVRHVDFVDLLAAESPSFQIDLWVSRDQLNQILRWCRDTFDPQFWDYHSHEDAMLGHDAVVARFYFQQHVDARAFAERWRR